MPGLRAAALGLACALLLGATAPRPADPADAELAQLESALAAAPQDAETRRRLGQALFEAGRAFDGMKVLNPARTPDKTWTKELRAAADLYARSGRTDAARTALKQALELDPHDKSLYEALAAVIDAGEEPPAPAPQAQRETAPPPAGVTPRAADEPAPPAAERTLRDVRPAQVAALAGAALAAVLLGLVALRSLRGKGDLAVTIELPPDRRGTFSVRLAARRPRRRAAGTEVATLAERASSRFEHNMVSRDTQFHRLPARTWWVVVEGVVEGTGPDKQRGPVFEDREVRVERGRAVRVEFDLRPRECPVEVRVVQAGAPAARARVALAGDLSSLRYAREGLARFGLAPGAHRILVGGVEGVAERELRIEDLAPKTLVVDLDGAERVFAGCESAVEPYLRGELSVAASALERAGQPAVAHLLRARFHRQHGELERAAAEFEAAGRPFEAAEAFAEAASFERAAPLFERAGDPARAAETYESAGDLLRAGRAYEEAGELKSATRCYREGNAPEKLLDVLEKSGEVWEAGRLSRERGDLSRALRNFQQVDARHAHYTEVCRFLAETFSEQGKLELAVQKADEAVTFSGAAAASPETAVWYGDLLERAGKTERALRAFEELLQRAPEHPGAADRVESLKKRLSAERRAGPKVAGASDRYEITTELGRGGMGVVYQARDRRLGRVVALKRLPDNLKDHPHAVELFLREARSAAALNHPNIVTIHDVDEDETGFFLTMELLEGQTLAEIVRTRGRVTPIDSARLGCQVATGLAYAHERRIVHRDIKTANLFFTRDRVVKIMDFGLAKMLEEVRKGSTVIGGTPFYMAPEQGTGEGVDHRADLYAFGVTLFELLTGGVPFPDGDVTYQHRHSAVPDPRSRVASLPAALAELVMQMMAKRPDERPASAAEVGGRLQRVVEDLASAR